MTVNRLLAVAFVATAGLVLHQPRPNGAHLLLGLITVAWSVRLHLHPAPAPRKKAPHVPTHQSGGLPPD